MKPLTESDGHTLVINTQVEGYKSIPRFRQFKVFYKDDVLSALELLKKTIGEEIKSIMLKPSADEKIAGRRTAFVNGLQKATEIIGDCFQFKEVKG